MQAASDRGVRKFAIAGGVASNTSLRKALEEECAKRGMEFFRPQPVYCTDNGAMIGVEGSYEYLIGYKSRDVVLDPNLAHHAHNDHGIFRSVVAYNGEIVGNWKPSAKDGGVTIFKSGVSVPKELIDRQVAIYSATFSDSRRCL